MRTPMWIVVSTAAAAVLCACERGTTHSKIVPSAATDLKARGGEGFGSWRAQDGTAIYGDAEIPRLWAACARAGRLRLGGLAGEHGDAGRPTTIFLAGRTYDAVLEEGSYGQITFATQVGIDDPAVATLLAGRPLEIVHGESRRTVAAEGAAEILGPIIKRCGG